MKDFARLTFRSGTEIKMHNTHDFVVRSVQSGETWEMFELALWELECSKLTKDSGRVLDVGSYTGIYSLLAATKNPDIIVEAFEPFMPVHDRLVANINLNGFSERIRAHRIAMSNEDGQTTFNITGPSPLPTGSSIGPHPTRSNIKQMHVPKAKGDTMFAERKVALMKIDAERHEFEVLMGFSKVLRRDKPVVFIEVLDEPEAPNIYNLMREYGYTRCDQICEDLPDLRNNDSILSPQTHRTNYIFRA